MSVTSFQITSELSERIKYGETKIWIKFAECAGTIRACKENVRQQTTGALHVR